MSKPLQVGIIWASAERGWAKVAHVPAVQGLAGLDLGAVATSDRPSAERAAKALGARAGYGDPQRIFRRSRHRYRHGGGERPGETAGNGVTLATIQGAHTLDTAIAMLGDFAEASALARTQYPSSRWGGGTRTRTTPHIFSGRRAWPMVSQRVEPPSRSDA